MKEIQMLNVKTNATPMFYEFIVLHLLEKARMVTPQTHVVWVANNDVARFLARKLEPSGICATAKTVTLKSGSKIVFKAIGNSGKL